MNIEEIIFKILNYSAHNWVRYWVTKDTTREECINIRGSFLTSVIIDLLLENGFKIDTVQSKRIDADAYFDITFKRYPN